MSKMVASFDLALYKIERIFLVNEHGLELAGKKWNYFYHLDWIFINVELKGQFCDGITFFL